MTDRCKVIENAIAIVSLRMSNDEWAQRQGGRMLPQYTTKQLLAQIAVLAMEMHAEQRAAS